MFMVEGREFEMKAKKLWPQHPLNLAKAKEGRKGGTCGWKLNSTITIRIT